MSDIIINTPVILKMDIVEIDNYLPSIQMATFVEISHPTGYFKYHANDLWFECSKWDDFVSGLMMVSQRSTVLPKKISLIDMSEFFVIQLLSQSNQFQFELCCIEPDPNGSKSKLLYSIQVDDNQLSDLINSFLKFPKWW